MRLKVLSWNIWYDGNLDEVSKFIREFDADIVGLQEVKSIEGVIQLSKDLLQHYEHVYTPVFPIQREGRDIDVGNAILSKYPIMQSKSHNLSKEENRKAIQADIKIQDKTLHVFSAHLFHTHQEPSSIQEEQADSLLKILPKENTILMGDFNALPDSNAVKKVGQVLENTDPNLLPTWSVYPEGCEVCAPKEMIYKLDYIFTSKDLKTHNYKVEKSKASDHLSISIIVEM